MLRFPPYASSSAADRVDLAENQQVIPAQLGNLVNQVSTSGNLVFPERETLTFGSEGTVIKILVNEGQQVTKGQVLARLDRSAVISLEEAVAQASRRCSF